MERDIMKNFIIFCISIVLFSIGIIVGAELNSIGYEKQLATENKKIDSIQDVVIKNVQAEQKDKKNSEFDYKDYDENNLQHVNANIKKISPYCKLTIEKYFTACGHTTIETIDIPKELVNMTESELQHKYEKWFIKKFEEKEIYLYREIDAKCSSHFVVKEEDGKVAVFAQITNDNMQYKKMTNIDFDSLRAEDKELIKDGVELYGEEELSSFIEDFES